ncbi:MAG: UDP-N-acetylmuramate dehydrogenase [Bacteroidales bacterium]
MLLKKDFSLKRYNTFGINAKAEGFVEIESIKDFADLHYNRFYGYNKILFLGGGSNLLFVNDYNGLIIKVSLKGKSVLKEDSEYVYVESMAGEEWDEFVEFCVLNNWSGIENLSLIPGNVGAAPIQNIGAYGVELKDVFHSLKAVNISSGEICEFSNDDCKFGYRDSIFKNEAKGQYVVISVVLKLKKENHELKLQYGGVKDALSRQNILQPSIKDVREVICSIRQKKLPDVDKIGSAGSFFKNPFVTKDKYERIKYKYPEVVAFKENDKLYKLAAAWLIDKAGWKAYREGDVGVYDKQALVLVNYGNAKGSDILALAEKIQKSVKDTFDVDIQPEVNIVF